jgi:hypothetical protein
MIAINTISAAHVAPARCYRRSAQVMAIHDVRINWRTEFWKSEVSHLELIKIDTGVQ